MIRVALALSPNRGETPGITLHACIAGIVPRMQSGDYLALQQWLRWLSVQVCPVGLEGTEPLQVQSRQTVSTAEQKPDRHNDVPVARPENSWAVVDQVIVHGEIDVQVLIIVPGREKVGRRCDDVLIVKRRNRSNRGASWGSKSMKFIWQLAQFPIPELHVRDSGGLDFRSSDPMPATDRWMTSPASSLWSSP
jgi:hypothetical protein